MPRYLAGTCAHTDRVARLTFLKPNSRKLAFFLNLVDVRKFICLFGSLLAFVHAKIICTKVTYHSFSKSCSFNRNVFFGQLRSAVFLPPRVWARRRQPVSRLNTADTWHVRGPSLEFVLDLWSVWMWFIIILIYREVCFLYVITFCGETVTPSAVFINHLATAMAILSNKWKTSCDSNRKYRSKWEETFVWVQ